MQELRQLLKSYQDSLSNVTRQYEEQKRNFAVLDLNTNLLEQINMPILAFIRSLLPSLKLTSAETKSFEEAFTYYERNQDLNLADVIIQDKALIAFTDTISNLWKKILKIKKSILAPLEQEITDYQNLITTINKVLATLKDALVIDVYDLIEDLNKLPLSNDTIILILREANLKNLKYYQHEIKQNEAMKLIEDDQLPILLQCERRLKSYAFHFANYASSEMDYILQSKIVVLEEKLELLKAEYDEWVTLKRENPDEVDLFKDYFEDLKKNIHDFEIAVNETLPESLVSEEVSETKTTFSRNLIFLAATFKDIDEFAWGECQPLTSKKMANLLQKLKEEENLPAIRTKAFENTRYQINKLKTFMSNGGTPRLFYQVVDNQIIVLLLGIEGRDDYRIFNNMIFERTTRNPEYNMLISAIEAAKMKPNEPSKFDKSITNQAFLAKLLARYKEVEEEFFQEFQKRCIKKPERQVG